MLSRPLSAESWNLLVTTGSGGDARVNLSGAHGAEGAWLPRGLPLEDCTWTAEVARRHRQTTLSSSASTFGSLLNRRSSLIMTDDQKQDLPALP